jgi:Rad3-related DNA helicase
MVKRGVWKKAQLDNALAKRPNCGEGFCKSKAGKSQTGHGNKTQKCLKCFTHAGPNGNSRPSGDLEILPLGMRYSACPYYEQVFKAVNGRKVAMNFSSFLFQTQMTKRFDNPREMMIIDECHNVEPQLMDFVSLTISDAHLSKYGIIVPELDDPLQYAVWFEDSKIAEHIYKVIEEARENDQYWLEDELSRTLKKYKMFLEHVQSTDSEWVSEYEESQTGTHKVTLKPVFVHGMAHSLLFRYAKRIVMMSATVLDVDVMCKSLGIKREHVAAIRLKNRFPVENRPIYLKTVAKMTGGRDKMREWGPELAKGVNEIVGKYPDKKYSGM